MRVRYVDVTVCDNDSVDIRCGGPSTLGFEFYVQVDEDPKDLEKFIRGCLREVRIPCQGITISRPYTKDHSNKLWTRRMIKMCIKREGPGMRPTGYNPDWLSDAQVNAELDLDDVEEDENENAERIERLAHLLHKGVRGTAHFKPGKAGMYRAIARQMFMEVTRD